MECWTEHSSVCQRKFNAQKHFRINTFKSTLFICKKRGSSDSVNKLPYQICLLSVRRRLIPQACLHDDTFNVTVNGNRKVTEKFFNQSLKNQLAFLYLLLLSSIKDALNYVNNKTSFNWLRKIYSTYIEILHQVNNFFTVRIFFKLHK